MRTRDPRLPSRAGRRVPIITGAALGVAAVVAASAIPMTASADIDLPDKTPAELIAFAEQSDVDALSGTIEQTSELGLADLGGLLGGGDETDDGDGGSAGLADAIDLLTGSHTAKVYLDGDRARLQVLDRLAERNVYVDGDAGSAWFVDSESQTATHLTLPKDGVPPDVQEKLDALEQQHADGADALPTPERLLDDALARLDETTEVSVGSDARVAGREVYELVLQPRTDDTLVGELRFAIDGDTGVPLSASITARGGSAPAFQVGFTDVSFDAPDAADLEFTPGDDVRVVERELPPPGDADLEAWMQQHHGEADEATPTVHGEGWNTVVELAAGSDGGNLGIEGTDGPASMLAQITRPVDGGRVLETALVTVLFADDGRVLAGAVPADRLVEVAASNG